MAVSTQSEEESEAGEGLPVEAILVEASFIPSHTYTQLEISVFFHLNFAHSWFSCFRRVDS